MNPQFVRNISKIYCVVHEAKYHYLENKSKNVPDMLLGVRVNCNMYRLLDLFSGCGGMTLGFTDPRFGGGFKSVFAIDHDLAAVDSYFHNFGNHAICGDVEEWASGQHTIPQADIVIGGPPCQEFSLLNKGRAGDVRRALWQPYMDLVALSGASVFVIENVQGLLNSPEHADIVLRAKELGFHTTAALLNAVDYGTPQTRIRAFILGWKREFGDSVSFPPEKTHSQANGNGNRHLPPWRTVRDAIGDLPPPVGTDLFGRLWWDRPSVTIRTEFFKPEKGRYLHPDQHRPITHREAARLMGFPDDFGFMGSKVEIARQ